MYRISYPGSKLSQDFSESLPKVWFIKVSGLRFQKVAQRFKVVFEGAHTPVRIWILYEKGIPHLA